MATTYSKTVIEEGKRLDEVVFAEYGNLVNFETVLELNPHIQSTLFVPQGTVLENLTVEIQNEEVKKIKASDLW